MADFTGAAVEHLARCHGVASTQQLREFGLSRHQIIRLRNKGLLVPVLHGVYRMPVAPWTELARCAAVCARHPTALIAGPTAGRLWGFRKLPRDQRIHIAVLPHAQPSITPWVAPHRTLSFDDGDRVERCDGIAVFSRLRTAADMGRFDIDDAALASILEQAMHDGAHDPDDLRRVAFPWVSPGRPWAHRVLSLLGDRVPGGAAESHAEFVVGEALVAAGVRGLVRQFGLRVDGFGAVRFDLAVPSLRWAIEVDAFPTHRETEGRRADRQRDVAVASCGWSTTRLVPADLGPALPATVARLRAEFDERRTRQPQRV